MKEYNKIIWTLVIVFGATCLFFTNVFGVFLLAKTHVYHLEVFAFSSAFILSTAIICLGCYYNYKATTYIILNDCKKLNP